MIEPIVFLGHFGENLKDFQKKVMNSIKGVQNNQINPQKTSLKNPVMRTTSYQYDIVEIDRRIQTVVLDVEQISLFIDKIINAKIIIFVFKFTNSESFDCFSNSWVKVYQSLNLKNHQKILIGRISDINTRNDEIVQKIIETMNLLNCDKYYEEQSGEFTSAEQKIESLTISSNLIEFLKAQIIQFSQNSEETDNQNEQITLNKSYLNVDLDKKTKTAKIVESPHAIEKVKIPSIIEHNLEKYKVTEISDKAFQNSSVKSVQFEENSNVVYVGSCVFKDSQISTFSIPPSIEKFHDDWCDGINDLTQIDVDENNPNFLFKNGLLIHKIPKNNANNDDFEQEIIFACRNIDGDLVIEDKIKRIGKYCFNNCKNLQSLSVSCEILDSFALSKCEELKVVSIMKTNELTVGEYCFSGCEKLNNFDAKCESLKLGLKCFENCSSIPIFIFQDIQNIFVGINSFDGCNSLESFNVIKSSSLEFSSKSFNKLDKLQTVFLESEDIKINLDTFYNCPSISRFKIQYKKPINIETNTFNLFSSLTSVELFTSSSLTLKRSCFSWIKTNLESISLGCTDLSFDNDCFKNLTSLTKLNIECTNEITIKSDYFSGCNSLEDVSIFTSKELKLEENCFGGFNSLSNAEFKGKKITVSNECFKDCSSFSMVKFIGTNKVEIGKDPFLNCTNLSTVLISSRNKKFDQSSFNGAKNLKKIILKKGFNEKIDESFSSLQSLVNFEIYNANEVEIKSQLFNKCSKLEAIAIDAKNKITIGSDCFNNNNKLFSINLFGKEINIANNCFNDCSSLNSFILKDINNIRIESNVFNFNGNTAVKKIIIMAHDQLFVGDNSFINLEKVENIKMHGKIIKIGKKSFTKCSSLKEIFVLPLKLGKSVTNASLFDSCSNIEIGCNSFSNCSELLELKLDADECIAIDNNCFTKLSKIETITIRTHELTIKDNCFSNCPKTVSIYFPTLTKNNISKSAFQSGFNSMISLTDIDHSAISTFNLFKEEDHDFDS